MSQDTSRVTRRCMMRSRQSRLRTRDESTTQRPLKSQKVIPHIHSGRDQRVISRGRRRGMLRLEVQGPWSTARHSNDNRVHLNLGTWARRDLRANRRNRFQSSELTPWFTWNHRSSSTCCAPRRFWSPPASSLVMTSWSTSYRAFFTHELTVPF